MYDPNTRNPSPEGSITKGISDPFGLAVDKTGTLYVANMTGGKNNFGSIGIYKAGKSSPSLTITNGLDNPYGVAVDSHGDVFVTSLGANAIVGYKPGATSPFETISFSQYGQATGLAIDQKDNLWIANDFGNEVDEIPAGSSTPQNAGFSGLNGPTGIAFGEADMMYVSNFTGSAISIYKYGTTSPSGMITHGVEVHGPTLGGFTASDYYFQSNQNDNVVGYKKGETFPFSAIKGLTGATGIASTPLVRK
jgi:serine/threonine-protein kinase